MSDKINPRSRKSTCPIRGEVLRVAGRGRVVRLSKVESMCCEDQGPLGNLRFPNLQRLGTLAHE